MVAAAAVRADPSRAVAHNMCKQAKTKKTHTQHKPRLVWPRHGTSLLSSPSLPLPASAACRCPICLSRSLLSSFRIACACLPPFLPLLSVPPLPALFQWHPTAFICVSVVAFASLVLLLFWLALHTFCLTPAEWASNLYPVICQRTFLAVFNFGKSYYQKLALTYVYRV